MNEINLIISVCLFYKTNIIEGNREIYNIILNNNNNIEINNIIFNTCVISSGKGGRIYLNINNTY